MKLKDAVDSDMKMYKFHIATRNFDSLKRKNLCSSMERQL